MRKTLQTVLIFAVVLAVLLGVAALVERYMPSQAAEADEREPAPAENTVTNAMTPDSATLITFSQDGVSLRGMGAEVQDSTVTIAYPGTYRVSGSVMDGQLVVDLGDFHGGVYLILDGADISCMSGPALYVKQADRTALYLSEGTQNALRDGEKYVIQEGTKIRDGAAVYSADDLTVEGEGVLTLSGNTADGIRTKDGLTVSGGTLYISCTDDGLQASDYINISGGNIVIATYGDGVVTKEGAVTVSGGSLDITSGGDGVQAMTELTVTGGSIKALTHGGADYYDAVALGEVSAKGLKGENITLSGGAVDLDTADDGIHAARDLRITGGTVRIASGDDAVNAAGIMEIDGAEVTVSRSYEGLEADTVSLSGTSLTIQADNNGIDAGEGGVAAEDCALVLAAPRGVSSEGAVALRGGTLDLAADGTDSLFSFPDCTLTGCTVTAFAGTNDRDVLLEKGEPDGALLFLFQDPVPAGTPFRISDAGGNVLLSFQRDQDVKALLVASGALGDGQTYTLSWTQVEGEGGDALLTPMTMEGTVGSSCTVVEPEGGLVTVQPRGGPGGGFPGGPRPW